MLSFVSFLILALRLKGHATDTAFVKPGFEAPFLMQILVLSPFDFLCVVSLVDFHAPFVKRLCSISIVSCNAINAGGALRQYVWNTLENCTL